MALLSATIEVAAAGATGGQLPRLFEPVPHAMARSSTAVAPGRVPVTISEAALAALPGSRVRLDGPGGQSHIIVFDEVAAGGAGTRAWIGHLEGLGPAYRVVLTLGPAGAYGRLLTPQGEIRLETTAGSQWLVDGSAAAARRRSLSGDAVPAPVVGHRRAQHRSRVRAPSAGPVEIDLMVVYTQSMADRHGAALGTRLQNLVDQANQSFADSHIDVVLRLVHSEQVAYSESADEAQALSDLTEGAVSANGDLSGVAALRSLKGADLVTLMRAAGGNASGACGRAWVNGYGEGRNFERIDPIYGADFGFSTVREGEGGGWRCDDLVLAHEIGHNLGSRHDHLDNPEGGVFSYSLGHSVAGLFATVMVSRSDLPRVGLWSNPSLICSGQHSCGVPIGAALEADNAASINAVAADVAAFRSRPTALFASVLPTSRTARVGETLTAFATILNAGANAAQDCQISLPEGVPARLSFNTTDLADNRVTSASGVPADVPPGGAQTFLLALTPNTAFEGLDVAPRFACANAPAAPEMAGVNTLLATASEQPIADLVALAATVGGDGIQELPGADGIGAFSVATINLGDDADILAVPTTDLDGGDQVLPLSLSICRTRPADGTCSAPPTRSIALRVVAGETPTFAVFAQGRGTAIPFAPAENRVFVLFTDSLGRIVGGTSVALRTR